MAFGNIKIQKLPPGPPGQPLLIKNTLTKIGIDFKNTGGAYFEVKQRLDNGETPESIISNFDTRKYPFASIIAKPASSGEAMSPSTAPAETSTKPVSGSTPQRTDAETAVACEKVLRLHKTQPERANFIAKLLVLPITLPGAILEQIDAKTKNLLLTTFYPETKKALAAGGANNNAPQNQDIGALVGNAVADAGLRAVSTLERALTSVAAPVNAAKDKLREVLQPIANGTGQVLADATEILNDPIGGTVSFVGGNIRYILDKINPGLVDRLELASNKLGLQTIKHLPGQVIGSLKQLAATVKTVACLPISLIGNLEKALSQITRAINALIDKAIAAINNFIFGPGGLLDGIFPIEQIVKFLKAVQQFSVALRAVSILSGGSVALNNLSGQLQGFSSLALQGFRNPTQLALSFLPPGATSVLRTIRNPSQLLQKMIPPKLSKAISMLSSFCNSNTTGNLGYLFATLLGPAKAAAAQYLFEKYVAQSSLIAPLLNRPDPNNIPAQKEDGTTKTQDNILKRAHDRRPPPPSSEAVSPGSTPAVPVDSVTGVPSLPQIEEKEPLLDPVSLFPPSDVSPVIPELLGTPTRK